MNTNSNKSEQEKADHFGYVVPENYFNELSSSVANKTHQRGHLILSLKHYSRYKIAASLALLIGSSLILYYVLNYKTEESSTALFAKNNDSSKVIVIKESNSTNSILESPESSITSDQSIDNAIIDVADELNLNEEELLELTELLEI